MGGESQAIVQSGSSSSSSSTAIEAPSAMPWALDYHPTLTPPASQDAIAKLSMAALDANEVVWLRAIQNLSSAQIGLENNPVMAARFKAIMVLQAHELYDARKAWALASDQVFIPILLSLMGTAIMNQFRDPDDIRGKHTIEDYNDAALRVSTSELSNDGAGVASDHANTAVQAFNALPIEDKINQIFAILQVKRCVQHYFIKPVCKMVKLRQQLFLSVDTGISDSLITSFENDLLDTLLKNPNQNAIKNELARAITAEKLKLSLEAQANAFHPELLRNDISKLQDLDVADLYHKAGLTPEQALPMQRLHESYLDMYRTHEVHYQDSVDNAHRVDSGFTQESYSQCFRMAFQALGQKPEAYLDNFMIELLLQQSRLPEIKADLLALVTDVYLPTANTYFRSSGRLPVTLTDYAECIRDMTAPLPSLQETVAQAHAILHCDAAVLALRANQSTIAQWAGQMALPAPSDTSSLMALAPEPLFPGDATVPGQITVDKMQSLSKELMSVERYANEFKGFDNHPQYDPNDKSKKSRPEAVAKFYELLSDVSSLEDINALLTVSKPYINRHRNAIRDAIFGVNNTETWKTCLKDARVNGLNLLRNSQPDVEALCAQRSTVLFASHRNESYLKGAWGRTSAQREIDGMIDEVKRTQKPK